MFQLELRPVRPSGQGPRVTAPKFRVRSLILRLGSGTIFEDQGIPSKTRVFITKYPGYVPVLPGL